VGGRGISGGGGLPRNKIKGANYQGRRGLTYAK